MSIVGGVVNRRSVDLSTIPLNGKENASNPLLPIHANRQGKPRGSFPAFVAYPKPRRPALSEFVSFVPLIRDEEIQAVLLDPNIGIGGSLYEKIKQMSEGATLSIIDRTVKIDLNH